MLYLNNLGSSELGFPDKKGKNLTIWVNGCNRNCKGCISSEANRMPPPIVMSRYLLSLIFKEGGYDQLILSGGEPFLQAGELAQTIREISLITGGKPPVICYTGNTIEELMSRQNPDELELLSCVDMLIDGEYVEELDRQERYRGSTNQRMIFLTGRYSAEEFPPMQRSISINIYSDHLTMSGIPSRDQAKVWEKIKRSDEL